MAQAARGVHNSLPTPRGVNGAAFAAWEDKVDFLAAPCAWLDGVNDGDSTLKVFLGLHRGLDTWDW